MISFVIMVVCLGLLAASHNVILINIVVFFLGAGMFLFRPTSQVWMFSLVTKNKQVHTNNVRRMVLNAGMGAGLIIDGFLAHHDFSLMFYFSVAVILVMLLILVYCSRYVPSKAQREELTDAASTSNNTAWFDLVLYLIYVSVFAISLIYAQLHSTYPLYLHQTFQLASRDYGLLFAFNTVLIVIFQIPFVNWAGRYSQCMGVVAGAFLIGGGMVVMTLGDNLA